MSPDPAPAPVDADDPARRALLDAASGLLAEEGADALSVRRIAACAGCSTMLVYSRLGGKQGVVDGLWVEGFRRLAAQVRAVRTTDDPLDDLRRCARAYRKFAVDNPTYYAVMFDRVVPDFIPSEDAGRVGSETLDVLAGRVQRAMDAGVFAPSDARQVAASLWAANHGLVSIELKRVGPPDIDWKRRHAVTLDALVSGFARTP